MGSRLTNGLVSNILNTRSFNALVNLIKRFFLSNKFRSELSRANKANQEHYEDHLQDLKE